MERNCHLVQTAVFAALFAAILVMNTPVQSDEAVLYDRLGGRAAIDAVVEQFNARVMADDALATYFTKTDMPSYKATWSDFLYAVTGGPCTYQGRSMIDAHTRLYITKEEFDQAAGLLVATLAELQVPEPETNELLTLLGPIEGDIVGR